MRIYDVRTIIVGIFLTGIAITDIIFILIRLSKFVVCRNIQDCRNRKCLVSATCRKYNSALTEEEYEELMELLNRREE